MTRRSATDPYPGVGDPRSTPDHPDDATGTGPAAAGSGEARLRWRETRAIAGLEALDGLRDRRQLIVRALTPVVVFLCVLGVTIGLRGTESRTHPNPYTVAVEGDVEGARDTLTALSDRLQFIPVDDARLAAVDTAELGVRIPDDLDRTLRDDPSAEVPIEIFQIAVDPPSRAGSLLLQSSFVALESAEVRERLEAAQDQSGVRGDAITLTVVNVERTEVGTRSLVSQAIPGLICLQAALLVAGTANRIVSRRTRGLLMAQLLLPVSRRSLATAKGLGELVVGIVTALPVVLAVLAFGTLTAVLTGSSADLVRNLAAVVLTMVVLFAFTTALGVVIGAVSRTQEQISLATGAAVIVAALVAVTVAIGERSPPAALAVVPVAGSVGALRDVLEGSGSLTAMVVATATTLVATLALTAVTGRALDAERMVMRNG